MCSGGGSRQSTPKFNDPRLKDSKYKQVASQLGIKKFDSASDIYQVEKVLNKQTEDAYAARLQKMEATQAANRREDIARVERQYQQTMQIQQQQFNKSMAAQETALNKQLAAQAAAQKQAEEAALRAQVPQMTDNATNARRVKAKSSAKRNARMASMGASQLRIPLGIGSQMGSGSPVKLNIGA